jgi:hypothetical protein
MKKKISFADSHAELLVNSAHGIYIPQVFVEAYEKYILWPDDSRVEETLSDLKSPDNEFYCDSWDYLTGNCKLTNDNGKQFIIYQNEDVWAVPVDEYELIDWEDM